MQEWHAALQARTGNAAVTAWQGWRWKFTRRTEAIRDRVSIATLSDGRNYTKHHAPSPLWTVALRTGRWCCSAWMVRLPACDIHCVSVTTNYMIVDCMVSMLEP